MGDSIWIRNFLSSFVFTYSYFLLDKMSSTSQKHRDFVGEPMGDKPVTDVAGIGPVLGGKLENKGFDKAYVLLGQFLLLKKDQEDFMEWMKAEIGANKKQGGDAAGCMHEWCNAFL